MVRPSMQCDYCGHEIYSDHLNGLLAEATSVKEIDRITDNFDCPKCGR